MTVDLGTQIRDYAQAVDAAQEPLGIDDLMGDYLQHPDGSDRPSEQRGWFGVITAVAASILVVVGVVVVADFSDSNTDTAGPTGDVEVLPFLDGLRNPIGVVFEPSGQLIIATHGGGIVRVEILPDGSAGEPVGVAGNFDCLAGLARGGSGALYFSNCYAVYRFTNETATAEAGGRLWWPATQFEFATGFVDPNWLALDTNGDLYVTDDIGVNLPEGDAPRPSSTRIARVEVLDDGSAGAVTDLMPVPGGDEATGIEFGPSGEMFVANDVDEIWAVTFSDDGSVSSLRLFVTIPGGPVALAFDASGTLYVGTDTGTVWSIGSAGETRMVATGFESVGGLAFDDSGTLYLTDVQTGEVLRIVRK